MISVTQTVRTGMPNRVIEIHDSVLQDVSIIDGDAALHFSSVYIHESSGNAGVDAGTARTQEAWLRIRKALVTRSFSSFIGRSPEANRTRL
jgi:hypothetical protein